MAAILSVRADYQRRPGYIGLLRARPGFQISPHALHRQYDAAESVLPVVITWSDAQNGHATTAADWSVAAVRPESCCRGKRMP